jgi:AcrR family transcriptional regulator
VIGYGRRVQPGGRRRAGREARERQILDAAVAVFTERGVSPSSMTAVAERTGLDEPLLRTHFGSTRGLFAACVERAKTELLEATSSAAGLADSPEGMLRLAALAFFKHVERNEDTWRLLRAEPAALESIRAQQTDFVASLLAERAPRADPYRLAGWAQVITGACERLAAWRASVRTVTAEQATDCLMDLVWAGLAGVDDGRVPGGRRTPHNGR